MKRTGFALVALGVALALIATGCGGGGGGNGDGPASTSYLPMQVGNTWQYRMTLAPDITPTQEQPNQVFDYHETITGTEGLDEPEYFIFRSVREATDQYVERAWQQIRRETDEAIYARVGNPAYDLPVLMLPPRDGDLWTDPFFPEVTFEVTAVNEQVTVPAGTFTCVRVEQQYELPLEGGGSVVELTRTWFARGVGQVKQQTLDDGVLTAMIELTDYSLE
jgi:hypothetical protein